MATPNGTKGSELFDMAGGEIAVEALCSQDLDEEM